MSQMPEQELRLCTDAVTPLRAEEQTPVTAEPRNGERPPQPVGKVQLVMDRAWLHAMADHDSWSGDERYGAARAVYRLEVQPPATRLRTARPDGRVADRPAGVGGGV